MTLNYAELANLSVKQRRKQPRGVAVKIPKKLRSRDHGLFFGLLRREGLPLPTTEFQFAREAMGRKWAMDYCWKPQRLFLEVDGGVFMQGDDGKSGGRHTRGGGWRKDTEKLNAAAVLGYRHLRCLPEQLETLSLIATIRAALTPSPAISE